MVNALVQEAYEGRARLRKVPVSCLEALQPEMSEWENPSWFVRKPYDEYIVVLEEIQGTETS